MRLSRSQQMHLLVEGFDVFDDYAETMEKNFIGTWYCPSWGMAFRIQEDGAYIYTLESGNIGFCNQEPYVWGTDRPLQTGGYAQDSALL